MAIDSGDPKGRREWLIAAREAHSLDREQAEFLIRARKSHLTGQRFERAVTERLAREGLSQPDMALLVEHLSGIGCSQNEISRVETGGRQRPNPKYVDALVRILHVSRDWVIYGGPQPKTVRIKGEMQGDESIRVYPEPERLELAGVTPDDDTIGYRVGTDAHGQFDLGDILLCSNRNAPFEECYGRWCVVELEDGNRYVGKVEPGASARVITMRPSRSSNQLQIDRTPTWISPILTVSKPAPSQVQEWLRAAKLGLAAALSAVMPTVQHLLMAF